LLSVAGLGALTTWYIGESVVSERPAYLASGLLAFVGVVLLLGGMVTRSWWFLRKGAGVAVVAWIALGFQLALPNLFGFTISLPLHVFAAIILLGGQSAFQSFFLYEVAGRRLRQERDAR
jgi:hypothetical protein